MIDFDEAARLVAKLAKPVATEKVTLARAHRRVLAEPVIAAVDSPPADVSSMDGYAVRESDLGELPALLKVTSESFAGTDDPGAIAAGECARIFTGAPLPLGADRVVMQEVVERHGDRASFSHPLSSSAFVRAKGMDFSIGAQLLDAGTVLGPRQLVVAAAADRASVSCWQRPRVRVLSTGDELAEPGTAHEMAGTIPESLSVGLGAFIAEWGGEFVGSQRLGDRLPDLEAAAAQALGDCDLVVVTGGASVGEKDFAKAMFAPLEMQLVFDKVAIKPGKPVWFGQIGSKLVLGLPGNPTSAMVTARLFLAPLLAGMTGRTPEQALRWRTAPVADPLPPCGDRETFVRAVLMDDGRVAPVGNQDSGAQHALANAAVLIRRSSGAQAAKPGEQVEVLDF